jgi:hypothetical protein
VGSGTSKIFIPLGVRGKNLRSLQPGRKDHESWSMTLKEPEIFATLPPWMKIYNVPLLPTPAVVHVPVVADCRAVSHPPRR